MVQIEAVTAVITLGLLVSALIVFCLLGIVWGLKRNQVNTIGRMLVEQMGKKSESQALQMAEWLRDCYGYDDAASDELIQKLSGEEKMMFKAMRTSVIKQDSASFQKVNHHYTKLKDIFREITPALDENAGLDPALVEEFEQELAALKQQLRVAEEEKSVLGKELQTTNDTLNSVIDEYSMMFGQKEDLEALQQSKNKLLNLLEQSCFELEQIAAEKQDSSGMGEAA
ncbi:MAG TPA: hypothetical protein DCF45_07770 [Gammaproteobacteria bacterium]|nr:hypothetical protein [Gammaproteobacteria bacterium]